MAGTSHNFPEPRAVYVHVPFCAHRCGYCDFTLVAGRDELIPQYLRALEVELSRIDGRPAVDTLFFGGGTPTHLRTGELARLLELVRERFELAEECEFSVEANPLDLSWRPDKVAVLADAGVNRISLGAQSFDERILRTLERDHRASDIHRAVDHVRSRIDNVSLDLIFGVPGQTLELWRATLHEALRLIPPHLSTYGLTYEKGTAFWARQLKGQLRPLPDELERDMYAAAMDELAAAGIEQYEISNFARPGFACRHNEVYWRGESYYGFGPGASRYLHGRRETGHRSVTTWIRRILAGRPAVGESEELAPEERARELLILGLRRTEGIDKHEFFRRTGFCVEELARDVIATYAARGLVESSTTHLRLTREGRFVADSVIVDLL